MLGITNGLRRWVSTYYDILGVTIDSNQMEIKRAYYKLAKQHHPDTNKGQTSEKFKLIAEAYRNLIDPDLKEQYDRELSSPSSKPNRQYGGFDVRRSAYSEERAQSYQSYEELYKRFTGAQKQGANEEIKREFMKDQAEDELKRTNSPMYQQAQWENQHGRLYFTFSCLVGVNLLYYALGTKVISKRDKDFAEEMNQGTIQFKKEYHSKINSEKYQQMQLKNAVAVVTGGASGIGESVARDLLMNSCRVAIWDTNNRKGEALATKLGQNAIFVFCNVTDASSVENAVKQTIEIFSEIHILVNCVGILRFAQLATTKGTHSPELFQQVIRINLFGTFNVSRYVAEQMSKQQTNQQNNERGVIIHISSVAGFEGQRGLVAYSASKGGVIGMTLAMARDLAAFKIRVVTIAPGIIRTPMGDGISEPAIKPILKQIPLDRLGSSSEVAHFIRGMIENEYVTGSVHRIDGGIRLPNL